MAADQEVFVKVNNKLVRVMPKEQIEFTVLNDDEMFEVSVLGNDLTAKLNNEVNQIVQETYDDLRKQLRGDIKRIVLNTLGFDNRYGHRWEVDHCNGRMSVVTELITDEARKVLQEEMSAFIHNAKDEILEEIRPTIAKEFKTRIRNNVSVTISGIAMNETTQFVTEVIREELEGMKEKIAAEIKNKLFAPKPSVDLEGE